MIIDIKLKEPNREQLPRDIHSSINRGIPTDLKPPCVGFQLAQINIVQQAFKERCAK